MPVFSCEDTLLELNTLSEHQHHRRPVFSCEDTLLELNTLSEHQHHRRSYVMYLFKIYKGLYYYSLRVLILIPTEIRCLLEIVDDPPILDSEDEDFSDHEEESSHETDTEQSGNEEEVESDEEEHDNEFARSYVSRNCSNLLRMVCCYTEGLVKR
ncbi:hypothetical protein QE152_g27209 [Popillia japonica]|uniref:Uncharacterized protein n=1 Tax=Popillia japonica TaxID=7064 RepID=A0AAW1JV43_POPJA